MRDFFYLVNHFNSDLFPAYAYHGCDSSRVNDETNALASYCTDSQSTLFKDGWKISLRRELNAKVKEKC